MTAEEPTPQEQVEDTIHADNAAEQSRLGEGLPADTASSASAPADEPTSTINAAAESVKETISNTVGSFTQTARNFTDRGSQDADRGGAGSDFASRSSKGTLVEPKSTIYVGNLFFDVTENDLMKELSRFGSITKCRLIRDSRGLSKG